ncbi:MAG: GerMN domain-containing protein [Armatimonadetes bacterium]|nr:GerMN domain-containing protein [Armatimonadota bacterium]
MSTRVTLGAAFIAAALLLAGCRTKPAEQPKPPEPAIPPGGSQVEPVTATLYFADADRKHLESEARDVGSTGQDPASVAKAAVQALLDGPQESGHRRTVPEGVTLNDVKVEGDLCTVDLSKSFVEKASGGSNFASLAVYGVVNTVCEVQGVKRVQLLFDGQPQGDFGGVLDLSQPLQADSSLLGGEKL